MPEYKYGDMFDELKRNNNLFVVTTNSYVTRDGRLVMGRGAALQLKNKFKNIDIEAGKYICKFEKKFKHGDYGFFTLKREQYLLGFLQVKRHFKEDADIILTSNSIGHMQQFVYAAPWIKKINMNYPCIGYGGLKKSKVKPALKTLTRRYKIWQFEK